MTVLHTFRWHTMFEQIVQLPMFIQLLRIIIRLCITVTKQAIFVMFVEIMAKFQIIASVLAHAVRIIQTLTQTFFRWRILAFLFEFQAFRFPTIPKSLIFPIYSQSNQFHTKQSPLPHTHKGLTLPGNKDLDSVVLWHVHSTSIWLDCCQPELYSMN